MHLQNRILDILGELDLADVVDAAINRRGKFVSVTCSMSVNAADRWETIGATLHIDITDDDILPEDDEAFEIAVMEGLRVSDVKEAA